MAKITWSANTAADLAHYEIRFCAGPVYNTDTENVIGNVAPDAPRDGPGAMTAILQVGQLLEFGGKAID